MQRELMRTSLRVLLSGLMLTACGAPELGGALTEEALGARESALCSGASVSSLTLDGVSSYLGEAAGSGGWGVSTSSNAVRLEYYVDGVQRSYEERPGTSGAWYFSKNGIACGSHTFEVRAFPMVIDSAGNRTTCSDVPVSRQQGFTDTSCMCVIDGRTYRDGQVNPASSCSICSVSQSRTSWTFNGAGYADTKGYCKPLTQGGSICANSTLHNGESCVSSTDCYTRCDELL